MTDFYKTAMAIGLWEVVVSTANLYGMSFTYDAVFGSSLFLASMLLYLLFSNDSN